MRSPLMQNTSHDSIHTDITSSTALTISSDTPYFPSSPSAASSLTLRSVLANTAYHLADFFRIFFITLTLTGQWLHQLFIVLDGYHDEPSESIQKHWVAFPILVTSFMAAVCAKTLNYHYLKKDKIYIATQDSLFSLFSSSFLFIIFDLVVGEKKMTLAEFIATSAVGIPILMKLFLKLELQFALSDSNAEFRLGYQKIKQLLLPVYDDVSAVEVMFNSMMGMHYSTMIAPVLWAINREINGKTIPQPLWQTGLMTLYLLPGAIIGIRLTEKPEQFYLFTQFSKCLRDGAYAYAAMSAIIELIAINTFGDMANTLLRDFFIALCACVSVLIGIFSAGTTRFQFQKNHTISESLIEKMEKIPEKCSKAQTIVGDGFRFVGNKMTGCCEHFRKHDEASMSLMPVV